MKTDRQLLEDIYKMVEDVKRRLHYLEGRVERLVPEDARRAEPTPSSLRGRLRLNWGVPEDKIPASRGEAEDMESELRGRRV